MIKSSLLILAFILFTFTVNAKEITCNAACKKIAKCALGNSVPNAFYVGSKKQHETNN